MTYFDMQQQSGLQNPGQWSWANPQTSQLYGQHIGGHGPQANGFVAPGVGLGMGSGGQAAYGPQYGQQYGAFGGPFGQPNTGALGTGAFGQGMWGQGTGGGFQPNWGQHRQLTQQDVGEVVRQLVPLLPHIVAQAQQPLAAFGYGGIGYGSYANQQRQLTQQDINEVVRQILPILPQIVGALQGQAPLHAAAMYGGFGQGLAGQGGLFGQGLFGQGLAGQGLGGQGPFGQIQQNPYAQHLMGQTFINQQPFGQPGWPAFQSAFGNSQNWGQTQRQLTPQDVSEVVRQLVWTIPQVIGNLQAYGQQRTI
jgi:hypothetical protein